MPALPKCDGNQHRDEEVGERVVEGSWIYAEDAVQAEQEPLGLYVDLTQEMMLKTVIE